MRNEWIIQAIGEKILLGFQGSEKFVEQSLNFAFNYEVVPPEAQVHTLGTDRFKFVGTTLADLRRGLLMEGRCIKSQEILRERCADLDPEENYDLDEFANEINLAAEEYCGRVMESIHGETFYYYDVANYPMYDTPKQLRHLT